jgi:hypothetical protein
MAGSAGAPLERVGVCTIDGVGAGVALEGLLFAC